MCAKKQKKTKEKKSDKMAGDEAAGGAMLKQGRFKGEKKKALSDGCLVILLHYDLPVKHPSPLPQHVEVELRKHWGGTDTHRNSEASSTDL